MRAWSRPAGCRAWSLRRRASRKDRRDPPDLTSQLKPGIDDARFVRSKAVGSSWSIWLLLTGPAVANENVSVEVQAHCLRITGGKLKKP